MEGRIAAPKGTGMPQEDKHASTNLDPWGSQRLNHQPKNTHGLDLDPPCTYVADVQLGLHMGPEPLEWGLSQKLLPI